MGHVNEWRQISLCERETILCVLEAESFGIFEVKSWKILSLVKFEKTLQMRKVKLET